MACLGVRCGGSQSMFSDPGRFNSKLKFTSPTRRVANYSFSPAISKKVMMTATLESRKGREVQSRPGFKKAHQGPEKFDRWMRESVLEIVKNLGEGESPLFAQVYGCGNGTRLKTEKAVAEDWAHIEGRWRREDEPSPEGIILVEELKDEEGNSKEREGQSRESTKAWGVLLVGKGEDGGTACYLLKTNRVGSSFGLFCTHFCLVKVKNFRESTRSHFKNCWLV
ncbi:hypothetical protein Ancab_034590 [Ancistrocladus abbreviatus]